MFQALTVPGAGVTAVNVMGNNLCSRLQPCGRLGRQRPNHRDTKTKIVHYMGVVVAGVVKSQEEN